MREERKIPFKNYFALAIVLILSIVLIIYFYMWYSEFEFNKINTPILDDYLSVINYNELEDYLIENKDVILYVSVLDNGSARQFENKFKNIIKQYTLNNNILYLDLTSEVKDDSLYKSIVNKYGLTNLPCILFFRDGSVYDAYSIKDNEYDMELLVSYLRIRGVIDD